MANGKFLTGRIIVQVVSFRKNVANVAVRIVGVVVSTSYRFDSPN
jgi:hypothetical protein